MQQTYNQMHERINAYLNNNHREKIEKAKLKFKQEKENEKRLDKKD